MNSNHILAEKYRYLYEYEGKIHYYLPPYFKHSKSPSPFVFCETFQIYCRAVTKGFPEQEAFKSWLFKNKVSLEHKNEYGKMGEWGRDHSVGFLLGGLFLDRYGQTASITAASNEADPAALIKSSDHVMLYLSTMHRSFYEYHNAINAGNPGVASEF